jgi:WD40 repeat protein
VNAQAEKGPGEFKYWAFLSYSHTDKKWGDWLHKALETYRIPRRLVGKESRDGRVPPRVFPIFRDREELPVSADLGSNINEALQESRYLIVICSPRSAQSRWVGEEIKTFKRLGREDRVLALIVDGEPNASDGKPGFKVEDECFHEAMRYRTVDGEPSDVRSEPIAADARESGDGKTNAKLKLLAGLLGVNYDDLRRREQERRLRRARAIGVAALVLVLSFAALCVALFFNEREAQRARMTAVEAEQQTKLRASRADADIGVQLAGRSDEPGAFAHAVRALELNPKNTIAAILAYRLLSDGPVLALPAHLLTHSSVVKALAFSRDGRRLATGCDDGSIMVVNLDTGERFVLPDKPLASVAKLAFSPDGQSIAFATTEEAGQKSAVQAWQYQTSNKPVFVSDRFGWGVLDLAWPLTDRIVVHCGRTWGSGGRMAQVFSAKTERWVLLFGFGDRNFIYPDGSDEPAPPNFVEAGDIESWTTNATGMLIVYDQMKRRLSWLDLHGTPDINKPLFAVNILDSDIVDVAEQTGVAIIGTNFTKTSRRAYFGDLEPKSTLKWADPRSREQGTIPLSGNTLIDRVSANGERLLSLQGNATVILDRRSGKQLSSERWEHVDHDNLLAFSQDGDSVVLGWGLNRVLISEFGGNDNGPHVTSVSAPARVAGADLDSSGKWLVISSNDKNVRVWAREALRQQRPLSLSKPESIAQAETDGYQVEISRTNANPGYQLNGNYAGEVFDICRVDSKTGHCNYMSSLQRPAEAKDMVTGYSFSPDGTRVAVTYGTWTGRPDNSAPDVAVLYDTATGHMVGKPLQHNDAVFSPSYSPDGKWFVTTSADRTVRRWDGLTGVPIGGPIHLPRPRRFAQVSPDGNLIVTSAGIIDARRWQVIKELTPEPKSLANALFSPDGSWLATTSYPGDLEGDLIALNQWDLQNAVQIVASINIVPTEEESQMHAGPPTHWLEPGRSVAVGQNLVWQCTLPCSVESILPFLQACRPLILGEAGEQIINPNCSLDSVNMKSFFPQGRTEQNQTAYDFGEAVLTRGAGGVANAPARPLSTVVPSASTPEPSASATQSATTMKSSLSSELSNGDRVPRTAPSPNGDGTFQLTREAVLVWNNYPRPRDEASWSGGRDAEGYAKGNGTITWFKRGRFTTRYTGRMVHGKLDGAVTNEDANGKKFHGTFSNGVKSADWSGDRH